MDFYRLLDLIYIWEIENLTMRGNAKKESKIFHNLNLLNSHDKNQH